MLRLPLYSSVILLPLAAVGALSACEPEPGTTRGPQPATSFSFDDDADPGIVNLEGELSMRSCGFSVREPNTDRYFADGQASTSPTPTTLVVYFPQTSLAPPPPGALAVPDEVVLDLILPSPYGTLSPSGGGINVSERDGWRILQIVDLPVSSSAHSGILNATLACGM